jgi:hypothetical protein
LQRKQRGIRIHRSQTTTPQPLPDNTTSSHPTVGPRTPGDRRGGQPAPTPIHSQRIQISIRRRVITLPSITKNRRNRRKQNKKIEITITSQLIKIRRRDRLRPQHPRKPLRSQRIKQTIIQNTSGMHDTRKVQTLQHPGKSNPIRHITSQHRNPRTNPLQIRDKISSPRSITTTTRQQHHMLSTRTRKPTSHPST